MHRRRRVVTRASGSGSAAPRATDGGEHSSRPFPRVAASGECRSRRCAARGGSQPSRPSRGREAWCRRARFDDDDDARCALVPRLLPGTPRPPRIGWASVAWVGLRRGGGRARLTSHVSRLTSHVSRLSSLVSRLSSLVSRLSSFVSSVDDRLGRGARRAGEGRRVARQGPLRDARLGACALDGGLPLLRLRLRERRVRRRHARADARGQPPPPAPPSPAPGRAVVVETFCRCRRSTSSSSRRREGGAGRGAAGRRIVGAVGAVRRPPRREKVGRGAAPGTGLLS